ncbi:MAG: bifunctional MaoC family dehydratase N-terminal/OB-fold nucleic acid binding domain-containing protein [Sciscionella sp.]
MSSAVGQPAGDGATERIRRSATRITALGRCAPRFARDPVNQPMVNNWVEAIQDANPVYRDGELAATSIHQGTVAPPAMIQVWTMNGLHGQRFPDDPLGQMLEALDAEGFTSVVATNSEQVYHRYLRAGERVSVTTTLDGVVGPKRTGLGEGWFVTTRNSWYVGDDLVGEMLFRVLKFRPPQQEVPPDAPGARIVEAGARAAGVLRPVISKDTDFFWQGCALGELRLQRWGDTIVHPPRAMAPDGGDGTPDFVVSSGCGEVYSYVVHHHPQVPGKQLPFVVALVTVDEGVRVLGELIDVDPLEVSVGLAVQAVFLRIDDDLTLPAWRVRS